MSKAAKNKKKRNVVRKHPPRKYGSKRSLTLSRKQTNLAPAQVIHRVSKGLPFSELEHLRGEIDEPLESVARRLAISRSTLQRRKAERRLSPQETDRDMRVWQLTQHVAKVHGHQARAWQGLKFAQRALAG